MTYYVIYFLVLGLITVTKCDLTLEIVKNIDNFLSPVTTIVEEKAGTTFSLLCELVSSENGSGYYDENLSWVKGEKQTNGTSITQQELKSNSKDLYRLDSHSEINKSEKKFDPLQIKDRGNYYCVSFKYNLFKNVRVYVRDDLNQNEPRPLRQTIFCNDRMFQCVSNNICIIQHYVCDGKPDCRDGSDESVEKCNVEPCKDKIPCDDGRCIPSSWCCDRNVDQNCTVENRPKCCQALTDSFEELEYGYPTSTSSQQNGARYLFISVCILSILFSIVLLLLILSKVVIFAKKTSLRQQRHNLCENIALRNQTNTSSIYQQNCCIPYDLSTYRNTNSRTPHSITRNMVVDSSDVNDPLIFPPSFNVTVNSNDQPPSYVDVLRSTRMTTEPPPPYTSREILNVSSDEQNVRV